MSGDVAEERRAEDSGSLPPLMPPPLDPRFASSYAQQPQQQVPQQPPQPQQPGPQQAPQGPAPMPQPQPQMQQQPMAAPMMQQVPQQPAQQPVPQQPVQQQPVQHPMQQQPVQQQAAPVQQQMPQQAGAQQPPPPQQQHRFPMARVFDGVNQNGGPTVNRQRMDPREVPALVAYLTQAPVALAAPGTTRDEVVPAAPAEVPRIFHTDGMWIWPAAVGYYLSRYQLPPQPELVAHVRSRNYALVQVPQHVRQAAASQIVTSLNPQQQVQPPAQSQPQLQQPPVQQPQMQQPPVQQPQFQQQPQVQPQPQPQAPAQPYPQQYQAPPVQPAQPAQQPVQQFQQPQQVQQPQPVPQVQQQHPQQMSTELPPVTQLSEFSEAFNAAGNRHAAWVGEQIETFLAFLPEGDWSVDHVSRRYFQSGRDFLVDGLGTLSPTGVWTWAWADPLTWGRDTAITEQSRRLRAVGDRDRIPELVTPALDIADLADSPGDPQTAAEMMAWTCTGLLTARGYIGHTANPDGAGGRIYYVVCDTSVPEARPTLGTVPRFLMDGAAAFAENATDCVLGYIEHHGWEWSRVPDGIVVAAQGLGSFTVEISADGRLTGLSLHR